MVHEKDFENLLRHKEKEYMFTREINSLPMYFFNNLSNYRDIIHFVSTRKGGYSNIPYNYLNLGFHVGDEPKKVFQNRKLLSLKLDIDLGTFTVSRQIHDGDVKIIEHNMRGCGATELESSIKNTDAMVTDISDICLLVLLADCVPVLFLDRQKNVIGAAHAGWKGTVKFIVKNTLRVMYEKYNSNPEDIVVGIGPSIGPCCYEVGREVVDIVEKIYHTTDRYIVHNPSNKKNYFDLWETNKHQILEMGVPEENIEVAEICTYCNSDIFFSERKQRGTTGRFGAGIMINKK